MYTWKHEIHIVSVLVFKTKTIFHDMPECYQVTVQERKDSDFCETWSGITTCFLGGLKSNATRFNGEMFLSQFFTIASLEICFFNCQKNRNQYDISVKFTILSIQSIWHTYLLPPNIEIFF